LDRVREVVGSNPAAPTFFRKKPFGKNVEGLSYFRDKSCAIEDAVQTHDFEDSTPCVVISSKLLLAKQAGCSPVAGRLSKIGRLVWVIGSAAGPAAELRVRRIPKLA
jgi:hypothetical protein